MSAASKRLAMWERALESSLHSWCIRVYETVSSTMDVARELAKEITAERPGIVLAQQQEAGRGRQGRSWIAPEGGFFGTAIFHTSEPVSKLGGWSLGIGCVLREVFTALGAEVSLKWPNDVLDRERRKLAGILIEVAPAEQGNHVLCGIGVNLLQHPEQVPNTTALKNLSEKELSPVEFAEILLPRLHETWRQFEKTGFAPLRELWLKSALFKGENIAIDLGGEKAHGTFVGVSDMGAIILESDSIQREIHAGDVIL